MKAHRPVHHHLHRLKYVERERYHPLQHKLHKKYNISKRTLFYVKEYGSKSHATRAILKHSIEILLFTAMLSSLGGLTLESIQEVFITIVPLIILLPALNDMVGDYGIILSSRISTMLHEGKIKRNPLHHPEVRAMLSHVLTISVFTAVIGSSVSILLAYFTNAALNLTLAIKIIALAVADSISLVFLLFFVATLAGLYFFKKKEDPNNLLIPLCTAIADFGNMVLLTILVIAFF